MNRTPRYAALAACLLVLSACASLGLTPAKSLSERIGYAYGTTTAVRIVATNALTAKQIGSEEATYVLQVTDQSRTLLDAARLALDGGDPSTAEGRLLLAIRILDELQAYLSKQVTS